jgi:hypothetical protein
LSGTWAADDKLTIACTEYTVVSGSTSASAIASAFATAYDGEEYTVSASSGTLTFTETSGNYGIGAPGVTATSTSGKTAVATTTAPVVNTTYTTFVLGDGSIEYTNCGAKVPAEMSRDPKTNGGQDTLYNRQRKCFSPYGISFTKANMATLSPTDAELSDGANWELVNTGGTNKKYINLKAIPIARILSLG